MFLGLHIYDTKKNSIKFHESFNFEFNDNFFYFKVRLYGTKDKTQLYALQTYYNFCEV